jgi:sugar lactone lactonase YvrE
VLASGYGILEAPTVGDDGSVYFSDITGGGVYRLAPGADEPAVVVPRRRGVGGMALHRDGGLVISGRDVRHVGAGPDRLLLAPGDVAAVPGLITSFNDFAVGVSGELYIGTVRTPPGHVRSDDELFGSGELLRLDAPGHAVRLLADVETANGAVYTNRAVLQADSARRTINSVRADGTAHTQFSNASVDGVPDGLALDADGNVWIAFYGGGCIACFALTGELLRVLKVPARRVTSVCFGRVDRTVYVTTEDNTTDEALAGCLLVSDIDVAGAAPPAAAIGHRARELRTAPELIV